MLAALRDPQGQLALQGDALMQQPPPDAIMKLIDGQMTFKYVAVASQLGLFAAMDHVPLAGAASLIIAEA
jgi:hypothetical protein